MPTSSFTGLDPERLDDLAVELRRQSTVLDDAHRSVRTALGLADLLDNGLLRRLVDRSERFQMVADELDGRAQMVRDFALGFPSPAAADAASARISAGLDSFDTIDELTEKVDNWSGSDNDPLLDDLIYRLHQAQADDESYRSLWAEWAAGLVALEEADLAAEQALSQIRSLLHVDDQSGWTPWHDGDAEVTPQDAADAMAILATLDEVTLALVIDQLTQAELNRLADGLAGDATHADKPWGHWVWSPVQAPVRETRNWVGEISAAGSEAYTGLAEGFYAMGTQQGGPSPYNPYSADHIEDHFNESGRIVLEGSIPLLSNGARCTTGDGWSCVTLGAEVALWAAGELVGGVIVSTVARTPLMTMVRVRLHDGSERVVAIINRRIRHNADEVVDPAFGKQDLPNWGTELPEPSYRLDGGEYLTNAGGISTNPLDHPLPSRFPQIPTDASVRPLTPKPGGAQYGVEFKFLHPDTGQTVVIRIHGPDLGAPAGSNAALGDVMRIIVGRRHMDGDGTLHPAGVFNPNSSNYDEMIANDIHIPWTRNQ